MREAMTQFRASLDEFISTEIFPGLCREWLYRQWETLPFHPMYVGANWGEGIPSIDLVVIDREEHGILFGKCCWNKQSINAEEVRTFLEQSKAFNPHPVEEWNISYAFFSRAGFTKAARRATEKAKCYWIDLEELDSGLQPNENSRNRRRIRI